MIHLHPIPDSTHNCPYCKVQLDVTGWYIPGMRNLADLKCPQCSRKCFGDLSAGQALYTPMLLEKSTGEVHDTEGAKWFAKWLQDSYAKRSNTPIEFNVEEKRPLKKAILLNCIDTLYGHSLLKLLNAQYYLDHYPEFDLIILIPKIFRWLVPDGVAAIWSVDLPLKRGTEWNDWLANGIAQRIKSLDECWLGVAVSHPHPNDYTIERFTRVKPFALDQWKNRSPSVTFIWREDRLWSTPSGGGRLTNAIRNAKRGFVSPLEQQRRRFIDFAETLKNQWHDIDLAIVGIGQTGEMPKWITDLRHIEIDDEIERSWCERYAASHVVVGVHGSNMLLPSAHAGATVELMHDKHWGNILQDILFRSEDLRLAVFRHRIIPMNTNAETLARLVSLIVRIYPDFHAYISPDIFAHHSPRPFCKP